MNSTAVCRCIAAYGECGMVRTALFLALAVSSLLSAADCAEQGLSPQEKLSLFKQLDQQAESAMQQRRPVQAVQLYQQAVCLAPGSARGFYGLGLAEAAAGDFVKARESLRTADRLQPTTTAPLFMQVRVNLSLNDLATLKANLREAADRFPHDAALHQELARLLAEKNAFVLALAEALRSQRAGPNDAASRVQLAVLENTVGAYEDAIRNAAVAYQDASQQAQERAAAAGVAGLSYESLGNSGQAIHYLHEAIRLDPSQENSYLALADLFEQSQKYADAVAVLRQAHVNLPNSLAVLLPLGSCLIGAEQYEEGVKILHELLSQAPNTPEAYIRLADAARKMGSAKEELAALYGLVRYQPAYPMLRVLIARALLAADQPDYTKVLDELARAESNSPGDPDIFYLRGKSLLTLGRYQEALAAIQRCIELRPMDARAYYQLANVYKKLGEEKMAREQFARVKYLESIEAK